MPIFLPGESHGQRSLVGFSPWGHKELDKTEATAHTHTHTHTYTVIDTYINTVILLDIYHSCEITQ